jgi:excinuclease ABC subunit C
MPQTGEPPPQSYNARVPGSPANLPCPPLPIRLSLPADPDAEPDLKALPPRPGVFALEDCDGATLALAITANVRRMVRARLERPTDESRPSRRIDYRAVARTVAATTIGSAFEADWAYLQLARRRLPATFAGLLDRWRGWFIHCNPRAAFPRFVKTSNPGSPPTGRRGVYLGPFADKHAAQRGIELLQNLFDLCRHHHILIASPHAAACAYKEMGKCPAPCDGSISMEEYRRMMRAAVEFAQKPMAEARAEVEVQMRQAGAGLDFERAERLRQRLQAMDDFAKPQYRFVDRLDRFRFLAVLPSEQSGYARLMLINGGWIEPFVDLALAAAGEDLDDVLTTAHGRIGQGPVDLTEPAVQNIGLVCWHLFRPRKDKAAGEFLPLGRPLSRKSLAASLRRLQKQQTAAADEGHTPQDTIGEREIEQAG